MPETHDEPPNPSAASSTSSIVNGQTASKPNSSPATPKTRTKTSAAETPSYTRLTDADRVLILKLHDDGMTLSLIAQRLNRSVSTIHDVVQTYTPTVDLAKRKLRAAAEKMADGVIRDGKPSDYINVLYGIKALEKNEPAQSGMVILVGADAGALDALRQARAARALPQVTSEPVISDGTDS